MTMSNEVAKTEQSASYVARYDTGAADPYAAYATENGPGIKGKLLTCSKGDWAIGKDKDPVKADARPRDDEGLAQVGQQRRRRRRYGLCARQLSSQAPPCIWR